MFAPWRRTTFPQRWTPRRVDSVSLIPHSRCPVNGRVGSITDSHRCVGAAEIPSTVFAIFQKLAEPCKMLSPFLASLSTMLDTRDPVAQPLDVVALGAGCTSTLRRTVLFPRSKFLCRIPCTPLLWKNLNRCWRNFHRDIDNRPSLRRGPSRRRSPLPLLQPSYKHQAFGARSRQAWRRFSGKTDSSRAHGPRATRIQRGERLLDPHLVWSDAIEAA
mmetsp:Transcript_4344/g.12339  ORF Transcript_4344/g.12339 Transcript_4344/m.12339 type:complete len:217 (-) Transcript_4344:75-725(-)